MSRVIKPIKGANYVPKIINKKNENAYGVLLHTRKSIEEFQINSDMEGRYTKEYQHHYWAANARLAVDGQVLDISIPLVLFNYEQTVTGGDIKFDLVTVEKVSTKLQDVAVAKFKQLQESRIYKYITETIGITEWEIIPLNTAHVHPGGIHQSFSGIDLRKDTEYPGVVYPLSKGNMIPSFSSIMAHIDGICKIVHSEYRLFNEAKNGDKVYAHGRCATIIRGYEPEPLPRVKQPEPVVQKMIDKIFNITPEQPKPVVQKEAEPRPSYRIKDLLDVTDGTEFLTELQEEWDATDFDPDTTMVVKENILEPVVATRAGYYGEMYTPQIWGGSQKKEEGGGKRETKPFVSLFDKKAAIVKYEIATWHELQGQDEKDIADLYNMVVMVEDHEEDDFDEREAIRFLIGQGYKEEHLVVCTENKLKELIIKEEEEEALLNEPPTEKPAFTIHLKGKQYTTDEINKIKVLLEEEKYLSFAKINQMSDYNIVSYYQEFYKAPGEED